MISSVAVFCFKIVQLQFCLTQVMCYISICCQLLFWLLVEVLLACVLVACLLVFGPSELFLRPLKNGIFSQPYALLLEIDSKLSGRDKLNICKARHLDRFPIETQSLAQCTEVEMRAEPNNGRNGSQPHSDSTQVTLLSFKVSQRQHLIVRDLGHLFWQCRLNL